MSGVYYTDHGLRQVLPDVVTLPQHFRAQGYVALSGGKVFHNTIPDPESWDESFQRPTEAQPEGKPLGAQISSIKSRSRSESMIFTRMANSWYLSSNTACQPSADLTHWVLKTVVHVLSVKGLESAEFPLSKAS